jgi:hypothetical protein
LNPTLSINHGVDAKMFILVLHKVTIKMENLRSGDGAKGVHERLVLILRNLKKASTLLYIVHKILLLGQICQVKQEITTTGKRPLNRASERGHYTEPAYAI